MVLLIDHALRGRQICAKLILDQGIVMVSQTYQLISTMIWLALVISNVTSLEVNSNAIVLLVSCGIRIGSMTHKLWVINYQSKSMRHKNRKRVLAVGQVKTKVRAAKIMVLQKDLAQQTDNIKNHFYVFFSIKNIWFLSIKESNWKISVLVVHFD